MCLSRFGVRSIFVSAFSDPTTRARADQAKPIAWLAKPVAVQKLVTTVNAALREKPGGDRIPVTMGNFAGPVVKYGALDGVRYRIARYLNDGQLLVATSDLVGEEALVILSDTGAENAQIVEAWKLLRR